MELSIASTSDQSLHFSLATLSVDCFEHIFSFLIPNGVLNLIFTGDKRVISKVCRTSRLSLHWTESRFVDWRKAVPTLALFPKLRSLQLTTWSPQIRTRGPANAVIFPASLVRLDLRFHGSSLLLSAEYAPILLSRLVQLEEFSLRDEDSSFGLEMVLHLFPPTLRSLRLASSDQLFDSPHLWVDMTKLNQLPETIDTLHLHAYTINDAESDRRLTWPSNLASVTDLSLRLSFDLDMAIGSISPQLRRLAFLGNAIFVGAENDVDLNSGPLQSYFPHLESLRTRCFKLKTWDRLKDLPPTLTELAADIRENYSPTPDLEKLNSDPQAHRYAAPKNLRRLEKSDGFIFHELSAPAFLMHFPSLILPSYNGDLLKNTKTYENRLGDLADVTYDEIDLKTIQSLPRSLTALRFNRFDSGVLDEHQVRSHLQSITLLESQAVLDVDLLEILPTSLVTLAVPVIHREVLIAISKDGVLPNLRNLHLQLEIREACELNTSHIPSLLKSLKIKFEFRYDGIVLNFAQHRHLTDLDLNKYDLMDLIPLLPTSLQSLRLHPTTAINLAIPQQALILYGLRTQVPNLKELHLSLNSSWLEVLSPQNLPRTSFFQSLSLPLPLITLYAHAHLIKAQAGLIFDETTLSDASEQFALSCLPRGLSRLTLPTAGIARKVDSDYPKMFHWKRVLVAMVKFQFPLLGLFMLHGGAPHRHDATVRALPPQISDIRMGEPTFERQVSALVFRNAIGIDPSDFKHPWHQKPVGWLMAPAHHILNVISLATIARFGPSAWRRNVVLQGMMLANGLGSAISASLLLRNIFKSGLLQPYSLGNVLTGASISLGLCSLFTAAANGALYYSLGSTRPKLIWRSLALFATVAVSTFRNQVLLNISSSNPY